MNNETVYISFPNQKGKVYLSLNNKNSIELLVS